MNKIKVITIIFFLIILTVGMIAVPALADSLNFKNLSDKKTYWYNKADEDHKLTSQRIIELYRNSSLYKGTVVLSDNNDEAIKSSVVSLLGKTFAKNTDLFEYLKSLTISDMKYSQDYELTSIDNDPVVLNMVGVFLFGKYETIELLYEAKTETLIYFLCSSNNENYEISYFEELSESLVSYYENELNLTTEEYVFKSDYKSFLHSGLHEKEADKIEYE